MEGRKTKVQSWYLDVSMLKDYYLGKAGGGRAYHHTAPINMTYALREALAIRKKVLGNEHRDVATSLNNLASLLDDQVSEI